MKRLDAVLRRDVLFERSRDSSILDGALLLNALFYTGPLMVLAATTPGMAPAVSTALSRAGWFTMAAAALDTHHRVTR